MVILQRARLTALLIGALAALGGVASAGAHHVSPQTGEIRFLGNLAPVAFGPMSVQATIKDGLGVAHTLTFALERPVHIAAANDWLWRVTSSDQTITTPNPLASGLLEFPLRGGRALTDRRGPEGVITLFFTNGAPPASVNVQLDALNSVGRTSSLRAMALPVPYRASRLASGTVSLLHDTFKPTVFNARVGIPVTWVNHDFVRHTVTSATGLFDGRLEPRFDGPQIQIMPQSNTFDFTFSQPGSYAYTCTIHPRMRGTIRVRA
jgi:plastocyanin